RFNILDRSRLQKRDSPRFEPQSTPPNLFDKAGATQKSSHIVSPENMKNYCLAFLVSITFCTNLASQELEDQIDRTAKLINLAILTLPDDLVSDLPLSER